MNKIVVGLIFGAVLGSARWRDGVVYAGRPLHDDEHHGGVDI